MPINFLADIKTPSIELTELSSSGSETITLKAPDAVASSVTYTFPEAPGTDGFVLSSLTNGTMSWVAGGSGGTNIGTNDLTIADVTRTLTMGTGAGYKFSILNPSTTPAQEWYRNASSIWTNLKIESTAGTAGKITFLESDTAGGSNYIALKAPNTVTNDVTYTLPEAPTAVDKVLTSSTAGVMSWTTVNKNYRNTIVTNSVNLVARNQTWTSGQWLLRGSVNKSWTYFEWFPYTGTFNIANGWPTDEVTMAGVKIGSLPQSGTSINLSATITAKSSSIGGGSVTGRVYVFQYRCSTIAADSGNHTSVQVQSDFTAFSIPDTDTAQGTCVSMDFTLGLNMAVGDYYLVAVNALTSSGMNQNDPVWFSYNITQLESVT
jgi:hypothetical protein